MSSRSGAQVSRCIELSHSYSKLNSYGLCEICKALLLVIVLAQALGSWPPMLSSWPTTSSSVGAGLRRTSLILLRRGVIWLQPPYNSDIYDPYQG